VGAVKRRRTPASSLRGALLAAIVLLVGAPAAAADCGKDILDDWQDNNVVDRNYPSACYALAFRQLPQDAQEYSTVVADFQRAERRDRALELAGETPDVPPPTREELEKRGLDPDAPAPAPPADAGAGNDAGDPVDPGTPETGAVPPPPGSSGPTPQPEVEEEGGGTGIFGELIGAGGTDTADEVPTAVKVLGGAAALLLALGAAGVVAQRRSQGRG
jgi:hypothetical protein